MFEPITSEVTLHTGMVLKEITTGVLFEVGEKKHDGTDSWEIVEMRSDDSRVSKTALTAERQTLAMKFFAEMENE